MNLLKWAKGSYLQWGANRAKQQFISQQLITAIEPEDFSTSLRNPDLYYQRAFQDFHHTLPENLRAHRAYFGVDRRGFGEDAFHTMWWRLIKRFRPTKFLEIGVYRGQTLSLVALLARMEKIDCHVTGISPFSSAGDSVSNYRRDLDYLEDTRSHFRHHELPEPELIKAYSTEPQALAVIASRCWDIIYIDGNHDYDVVQQDWAACAKAINLGGLIVLDDSGLTTAYHPPSFATGGHPGPSQFAAEIDQTQFQEILQVGHNRVFQRIA